MASIQEYKERILLIIRTWPDSERLTWETFRGAIAKAFPELKKVWSRQALSASEEILYAYKNARKAVKKRDRQPQRDLGVADVSSDKEESELLRVKLEELQLRYDDLENKYDRLLLRHTRLLYNASQIDGAISLLDAPLPNNTSSQK